MKTNLSSLTFLNLVCMIRNNAGKYAHKHAISEDGVEMTFATNYLGN